MRAFWLAALVLAGCGIDSSVEVDGSLPVEELEGSADSALTADVLSLKVFDADVAPGTLNGRLAQVVTTSTAARAALGAATPSVDYSRNWLVLWRPEGKSATSRVVLTRAQLSATGATLSLWATVTEPGAGCAPWLTNELAVGRIPKRTTLPTSIRVYVTRATAACGLQLGGPCADRRDCAQATPLCHGSFELPDGTLTAGVCAKYPAYSLSSASCTSDAACGADGLCAGLTHDFGLCQPGWMRGTWSMPASGQLSVPLPQGGAWHRAVVRVSGQASVPMDSWAQVFVDGLPSSRVEWRLANPTYGTTSAPQRGLSARLPVNVPGDEGINGDWVLEVRDTGSGAPGTFRGVRLSFTSRWD